MVVVVVAVIVGVAVIVVVVIMEVELVDDHVRFGTYHRLDFDHQS